MLRAALANRAFRSSKTVDPRIRPIFHRLDDRIRTHVFLCMLAYYVEWHLRRRLATLFFDHEDLEAAPTATQSRAFRLPQLNP